METINRADAISYLADLYKTAGDGKHVLPKVFTAAVCDICDVSFVEDFDKYAVRDGDNIHLTADVEVLVNESQLKPKVKHSFEDICLFVKWDVINEKLKQLNKEVA